MNKLGRVGRLEQTLQHRRIAIALLFKEKRRATPCCN